MYKKQVTDDGSCKVKVCQPNWVLVQGISTSWHSAKLSVLTCNDIIISLHFWYSNNVMIAEQKLQIKYTRVKLKLMLHAITSQSWEQTTNLTIPWNPDNQSTRRLGGPCILGCQQRMLIIILFVTVAAQLIVSIICTQLNLGHLAPCSWEPVVISLNYLLLNMNSTNKTLLFDRFLIMYNLCVFTCIILTFVFHCTHVRMSYVLNSYLLTYLL